MLHGHVDRWSPASCALFSLLPPDNATGNFLFGAVFIGGLLFNKYLLGVVFPCSI
jgi:hypothetical protein